MRLRHSHNKCPKRAATQEQTQRRADVAQSGQAHFSGQWRAARGWDAHAEGPRAALDTAIDGILLGDVVRAHALQLRRGRRHRHLSRRVGWLRRCAGVTHRAMPLRETAGVSVHTVKAATIRRPGSDFGAGADFGLAGRKPIWQRSPRQVPPHLGNSQACKQSREHQTPQATQDACLSPKEAMSRETGNQIRLDAPCRWDRCRSNLRPDKPTCDGVGNTRRI